MIPSGRVTGAVMGDDEPRVMFYKYPVHRHCGKQDCTSRKRLWHKRFKAEVQRRPNRLGGRRVIVAGMVWGHWFRAVRLGR
jgi:hypothetical protein